MLIPDNESIVIICAADDGYVKQLAVTVRSLLLNHKSSQKIALFVIDGGIQESNKRKILNMVERCAAELTIEWLQPDKTVLANLKTTEFLTVATYYRLLIPTLLPDSIKKVIYIDCDLVVHKELTQLWNMDMGENYILAAEDRLIRHVSASNGLENYQELGIPATNTYFNAGVLVINLEKWRTEGISAKVIEYIKQNEQYVRWLDQDGLNAILWNKWGKIDTKWNRVVIKEDKYDELVETSHIIHFASGLKPWHIMYKHPIKRLFFQYLDMTPWSGWRPREPLRSILNRYWWNLKYKRYWWKPF